MAAYVVRCSPLSNSSAEAQEQQAREAQKREGTLLARLARLEAYLGLAPIAADAAFECTASRHVHPTGPPESTIR